MRTSLVVLVVLALATVILTLSGPGRGSGGVSAQQRELVNDDLALDRPAVLADVATRSSVHSPASQGQSDAQSVAHEVATNDTLRKDELRALWEIKYDKMTPEQLIKEYQLLHSYLTDELDAAAVDLHRRGMSTLAPLDGDGAATSTSSEDRLIGIYVAEGSVAYNVELNRENARDVLELRDEALWVQARAVALDAAARDRK